MIAPFGCSIAFPLMGFVTHAVNYSAMDGLCQGDIAPGAGKSAKCEARDMIALVATWRCWCSVQSQKKESYGFLLTFSIVSL
jgi:hypothetical protein